MSGFYITPIRLAAPDFPGHMSLFTNLKKHVYFRNAALDYIQYGGWAELPKGHYDAFIDALQGGWVRGERFRHEDYHSFVQKWRNPNWISAAAGSLEETERSSKLDTYVVRSKELLAKGITRPFTNDPRHVPTQVISHIVETLERTPVGDQQSDFYSLISFNLKEHPDNEIAHRTFNLLSKRTEANHRFAQLDILDTLSTMNLEDRKAFLSWLFKSPQHLADVRNANYSAGDIIMRAVERGEVWFTGEAVQSKELEQ